MDHVKRLLFGWYVLTGPRAQNNSFAGFSDWMFIALGGVLAAARSGGGKREPQIHHYRWISSAIAAKPQSQILLQAKASHSTEVVGFRDALMQCRLHRSFFDDWSRPRWLRMTQFRFGYVQTVFGWLLRNNKSCLVTGRSVISWVSVAGLYRPELRGERTAD